MSKGKRSAGPKLTDRIATAKVKTGRVVDHLLHLLALHENNAIISYSPKLAAQIPTSYAANAFQIFQHGLHRFELVRLCALWDGIDQDKENIPTIINLIDQPDVIDALVAETASHWRNLEGAILNPPDDPELLGVVEESLKASNAAFGKTQGKKVRVTLNKAILDAQRLMRSSKLASIMNLRDKSLAHSLAVTRREKAGPVEPMKYGYERDLLNDSIAIVEALHLGVNGTSIDFAQSRSIGEKNAKALWEACTFNIKR